MTSVPPFLALGAAFACALFGQSFNPPPDGESVLKPKLGCAALRSLTSYEFTVVSATLMPGVADAPEFCRVAGQILPEIRFEVNLPTAWNRRFYMSGNGGYAGDSPDSPQRAAGRLRAVRRGYASAVTDTGHDAAVEPLATFAQNRQKLYDYAFRSLHVTAETAKRVIAAYYGVPPARSYFVGCSTGGRQALILAQRFPDDFDGIVAGAPVLNFTGTMLGYTCNQQALAAARFLTPNCRCCQVASTRSATPRMASRTVSSTTRAAAASALRAICRNATAQTNPIASQPGR
jgi:hypothetical protein